MASPPGKCLPLEPTDDAKRQSAHKGSLGHELHSLSRHDRPALPGMKYTAISYLQRNTLMEQDDMTARWHKGFAIII